MEMTSYQPGTPSWVDIGVPDVAKGCAFYGALFGWTFNEPEEATGEYVVGMLNDKAIAGVGKAQRSDMPPYWTTYVTVDDMSLTAKQVENAGGESVAPPMTVADVGTVGVFQDPSGALFSAWQPGGMIGSQIVNEPNTLVWNELLTREVAQAKEFYSAVFGWEPEASSLGGTNYTSWMLDGRSIGGLLEFDKNWPAETPSFWMTYFGSADIDESVAKVKELGGKVMNGPIDIPIGRMAVVQDNQGATFSIIQLTQ